MEKLVGFGCLVVIVLGCIGACAFCYCSTLIALAGTVGPTLLYFASLTFSTLVPVLYGRALFRVFGRDGLAGLLMAPLVTLLVLVYVDYAYLFSVLFLDVILDGPGSEALFPGAILLTHGSLQAVALSTMGNDLFHAFVGVFAPSLAGEPAAVTIGAAGKLSCIPALVLVARGVSTRATGTEQPARVEYFHSQAFVDLGTVLVTSVVDVFRWLRRGSKINAALAFGPQAILIWPLILIVFLSMIAPVVVAATMLASIAVFHSLSLALIWLGAMWISKALYQAERAVLFVRSRYAKCPYHHCHGAVPLPVFACPECGARHDRLVPGRFGFLWRTCQCGRAELPTLFILGKGRCPAYCPHCDGPMPDALFGSNVHVPVYGGPSSGKTMLVMSETYQMLEDRWSGVSAALITEQAQRSYASTWKPEFERGQVRKKTWEKSPDAFLLSLRREGGLPVSLYLYDPAGEVMGEQDDLRQHTFLRYMDGLMLLIDPLSLPSFAAHYRSLSGPDLSGTTSTLEPADYLDRLMSQLEEFDKASRARGIPYRVAVVFTKADIPHFQADVGATLGVGLPTEPWEGIGARQSRKLETWLRANEPELHNVLSGMFTRRRFFAVSATGHLPSERRAFEPQQVLHPLAWLLSSRRDLTQPLLYRGGRLLGETALAAGLFSALTWMPVLGVLLATVIGLALA